MPFHPYLFFGGNCRAAFTRYAEIFGGDVTMLTTRDMPPEEQMPGAPADAIMHAALVLSDGLLMGSDDPTAEDFAVRGMQLNYSVVDSAEAERVFEALAEGGEVTMPMSATSWSPSFGLCIDRFGTPWMISADPPAQGS